MYLQEKVCFNYDFIPKAFMEQLLINLRSLAYWFKLLSQNVETLLVIT